VGELTGSEPDLKSGDTGEGVVLLQVRLFGLGLLHYVPDGTFNQGVEDAVRELQSSLGQDNTGDVTRETWEGILYLEQQAGINYQYMSPYDAVSQINYDMEHPEDGGPYSWASPHRAAGTGEYGYDQYGQQQDNQYAQYAGQLSEDGQWRFDGNTWQPAHDGGGYDGSAVSHDYVGQLSDDGRWRWDGTEWQPAEAGGQQSDASDGYVGQLSPDGRWRWDGSQWQAA
jgi:hypothetical protein